MKVQVIWEGIVVGVGTVIFYTLMSKIVKAPLQVAFLTGFFIHLFCEVSTINKWYCKNGSACKS